MELPTIALVIGKIIMTGYIVYVVMFFEEIAYAFYHLLFAGIAGSLVTFVITYYFTKKFFPFTPRFHPVYWKKVFKEALPYGIAIILSTLYFKIDVLLLSFFRDKNEISLYGYPSSIIELLGIFPIYFMNSTLPTLTRAFEESKDRATKIITLSFNFLALMALPMALGGVILARPLMGFIMSEEFLTGNVVGFYGADVAFQLLIVSTLFTFFTTLFSFTLIASGNQAKLLKINLYGVLFNIITNLLFIPSYGFIAAGITTIFSEILIVYLTYKTAGKYVQLSFDKKPFMKILAATCIMGAFVFLIQNKVPVFPLVGIGAAVFIGSLVPLRILTPDVLEVVKKK